MFAFVEEKKKAHIYYVYYDYESEMPPDDNKRLLYIQILFCRFH